MSARPWGRAGGAAREGGDNGDGGGREGRCPEAAGHGRASYRLTASERFEKATPAAFSNTSTVADAADAADGGHVGRRGPPGGFAVTETATTAEARLARLGVRLPGVSKPLGPYVPAVRAGAATEQRVEEVAAVEGVAAHVGAAELEARVPARRRLELLAARIA